MNRKKNILLLLIVGIILALGFYRDFLFKSINALLKAWDYNIDYSLSPHLRFIEEMEYDSVVRLKWVLTLVFTLLYLLISLFTLRILFQQKSFLRILLFSYGILIFLSGLAFLTGKVFPSASERTYEFARYLMGMAQSPLVLMILIPCFVFIRKQEQLRKNNPE